MSTTYVIQVEPHTTINGQRTFYSGWNEWLSEPQFTVDRHLAAAFDTAQAAIDTAAALWTCTLSVTGVVTKGRRA